MFQNASNTQEAVSIKKLNVDKEFDYLFTIGIEKFPRHSLMFNQLLVSLLYDHR